MPHDMPIGMQDGLPALRVVSADQIAEALPVHDAVDALYRAFRASRGQPAVEAVTAPARTHLRFGDGTLLVMPAVGEVGSGGPYGGIKLVTVRAENARVGAPSVQAIYALFGGETLAPLAVLDGAALTNLRTSAVSALATRLLARPGSERLLLFGAGAQARAHLSALRAVLPLTEVVVVSRSSARADDLVARARAVGLSARAWSPGGSSGEGTLADLVAAADVVCTCTTSTEPLFDGQDLTPGAHVVAVGAYQPTAREVDTATMVRGRVVVEERTAAFTEAGELALPIAEGQLSADQVVADLAELCSGATVRRSDRDITVFKSVGLAAEDLVVATAVWGRLTR